MRTRPPGSVTEGPEKAARYVIAGHPIDAPRLPAGLYVVATPIGHLRDITLRALETLAASDLIACEDTRITRRLVDHYGIATPLTAYHEHNAADVRPKLLARLASGQSVALVSDAGTPLISDPGFKLVREACDGRFTLDAAPGPSALLDALVLAGLPTDRFLFEGFLPSKDGQRRARIAELAAIPATLVLYESGPRIERTLAACAEGLGLRSVAVCRELTKLHQEVRRGELSQLAAEYAEDRHPELRGEFTLVIGPPQDGNAPSPEDADVLLRSALQRTSLREAVDEVVAATGLNRRAVYRRALELSEANPDRP